MSVTRDEALTWLGEKWNEIKFEAETLKQKDERKEHEIIERIIGIINNSIDSFWEEG